MGAVAARFAGQRFLGVKGETSANAIALAAALGGLKGPLMKVAQMLATIPDALPPEYVEELSKLQSQAPSMGWPFVRRRMAAELGPDWRTKFAEFDRAASASASLGQVHKATSMSGQELACKLQYPDMESAVAADLKQLEIIFALHRRMDPAVDTREIGAEIGARLKEELDYERELKHIRLYTKMLEDIAEIRVPGIDPEVSTIRLLTMEWLHGEPILDFREDGLETRNRLATAMFKAWWHPFANFGVIHGDPHLGNYSVFRDDPDEPQSTPAGINLLDYGCIRIFPPSFVQGVMDLYLGFLENDRDRVVSAYQTWGFKGLNKDIIEILDIWAQLIFGPLLDDRVRTVADGVEPGQYGRKEAFRVHQALKEKGPITLPREFVFMDRAAIGLGGVFLHLKTELNFHELFNHEIEGFKLNDLEKKQDEALSAVGLVRPD